MDWITRIKTDENAALKELYTSLRNECVSWIVSKHKLDTDQAKEIFQASVIILYDNVMSGKLIRLTSSIKSYLYSICRNKALEQLRHNRKQTSFELIFHPADTSEDQSEEKQLFEQRIEAVRIAMNNMGDPCKSLLQLYYYKKLSMADITNLMGYKNADTTKNQKYKCIKRLQSIFKNHKAVSK